MGWSDIHNLVKLSADGKYQWYKELGLDVSKPWGNPVAFMSVALNGRVYFTITKSEDVHVLSFDVGITTFYVSVEMLFLLAGSIGVVAISIIILVKRIRVVDYFREYKNRYEL